MKNVIINELLINLLNGDFMFLELKPYKNRKGKTFANYIGACMTDG